MLCFYLGLSEVVWYQFHDGNGNDPLVILVTFEWPECHGDCGEEAPTSCSLLEFSASTCAKCLKASTPGLETRITRCVSTTARCVLCKCKLCSVEMTITCWCMEALLGPCTDRRNWVHRKEREFEWFTVSCKLGWAVAQRVDYDCQILDHLELSVSFPCYWAASRSCLTVSWGYQSVTCTAAQVTWSCPDRFLDGCPSSLLSLSTYLPTALLKLNADK